MNEEEIIKKIYKNEDNRIIFRVKNGYKKLRQCRLKDEKKVILLDNIPLVTLSETTSPMSSSVIKLIKGRSCVDENIRKYININIPVNNLKDNFDDLKPFLKLLDDGEYELRKEDMIPTDGENNYFWNSATGTNYYHASADIYHNGRYIKGTPKFLMPSEGIECFNEERVNYYREKIRNGEELLGVVLELRGFMALLLDGHHKATAAYLEGKKLKCLIISNCSKEVENLDIDSNELKMYECNRRMKKINIEKSKEVFPNFKAIAVIQKDIDVSNEKIEKIFSFQSNHPIEELQEVFYYLTIYNKEKAKNLCYRILKRNDFQILWGDCLSYLSLYRVSDVKKLFTEIRDSNKIKYSKNFENNFGIVNRYLDNYIQ